MSGAAGTPLAAAQDGLMACVHCGFCLQSCPTYLALGDENEVYAITLAADGLLYGVTRGGGKNGGGTIFRLDPGGAIVGLLRFHQVGNNRQVRYVDPPHRTHHPPRRQPGTAR